jgi:tetratricopeptide (TPR) repeat protein
VRLTPAQYAAVKALFETCLELPADEREARIAQAALDEAALAELHSLLAHHDATAVPDLLDAPDAAQALAAESTAAPDAAPPPDRRGQRLGAWEVTGFLGSGGMGEVHAVRRADGSFQGEAAAKLLKRGMDSAAVLARFAQERQALARLSHPHIARLLDAGLSDEGLPFFVMEKVGGQPLDQALHGRPVRERVEVFLQLVDAVAHAHRRLLVHRDLKPGNVLVEADTAGRLQVKLLDFGIAKALDPLEALPGEPPDAVASRTQAGQRPFTPHYASPEQVRGEPVTTATDVYGLGVLLYQVLTGRRPVGQGATTPQAVLRAVLDTEPPRASEAVADPQAPAVQPAVQRALRGDLDRVIAKALRKDPAERHASAEALGADLRAWLDGFPVSARAPSRAYLLRRFVGRHRAAVAAGSAAVLALAATAAVAWHQRGQAIEAAALAERRFDQVRGITNGLVWNYHDRLVNLPGTLPVREALVSDAAKYLDALAGEGRPGPALARELAQSWRRLSVVQGESFAPSQERLSDAASSLDKALALQAFYVDAPGVDARALGEAAEMWMGRSTLHQRLGEGPRVAEVQDRAQALLERAVAMAPGDPELESRLATLEGFRALRLGVNLTAPSAGRPQEALPWTERAADRLGRLRAAQPQEPEWAFQHGWAQQLGASTLLLLGRNDEAQRRMAQALAAREAAATARPDNVHWRMQVAVARLTDMRIALVQGDLTRAESQLRAAEAVMQAIAADPANRSAAREVMVAGLARGMVETSAGRHAQARATLEEFLRLSAAAPAQDAFVQRLRADARLWLARAWRPADPLRALTVAREGQAGLPPLAQALPTIGPPLAWIHGQLIAEEALAALAAGQAEAAREAAARARAAWAAAPEPLPPALAAEDSRLARALAGG